MLKIIVGLGLAGSLLSNAAWAAMPARTEMSFTANGPNIAHARSALSDKQYHKALEYTEQAETALLNTMILQGATPSIAGMPQTPDMLTLISARQEIMARDEKQAMLTLEKVSLASTNHKL